ncbi:hypothetical protein DICPUDRAFT_28265 [Dictyostelium purpureum]|uniref:Origin recognition complex subunit 2 n=1 Tax=Dictyostelium purpureum TaxID=5786 RepID=F0ZBP8_DICPU|nr:uncharacterized protein DICPUDRAFT_28265 [Dictyostelium purpureum]EGC38636.1 hypothetical protein DICPUDRAFT_28265 [Dictyostelium purpureum]|eukprot:XP_003284829.1 hypothetical protein DICPUDRAFT_28265 [Dictyostelium purpureum]
MKREEKKEIEKEKEEKEESSNDEDEEDDYFTVSNKFNKTSKNIIKPLDPKTLHSVLSTLPDTHPEEKTKLIESYYKTQDSIINYPFNKMYNDLKLNYSLLINGVGDKSKVLKKFVDNFCVDGPAIFFKGYLPTLSIRDLLFRITFSIFGMDKGFGSPITHCNFIKSIFESNSIDKLKFLGGKYSYIPENLYIVVLNIDGPSLRNTTSQTALALLSSIPQIHLIATIETYSPTLLWDSNLFEQFYWVKHTLTTYLPYKKELTYQKSLINQNQKGSSSLDPDGVLTVLQSLTPNTTNIFTELLEHLIKKKIKKIEFKELFEICKEGFLVSSELGLKNQLREFLDHKIIVKKIIGDTEYLLVPLEFSTMQIILDKLVSFEEKE